ncbi:hypothetical protein [Kribbella pratensis]|uniref:hypothetical protein n=1 Tax=Kribbella pratensis TaxID=2512112 RepID=UPI00106607F4|nr:hypothetical protein [Kribbella pratensis]
MSEFMSEAHRGDGAVEFVAHDDSPPSSISHRAIDCIRQRPSLDAIPRIERNSRQHGKDIPRLHIRSRPFAPTEAGKSLAARMLSIAIVTIWLHATTTPVKTASGRFLCLEVLDG